VPGECIDGQPLSRFLIAERARPGTLMVDSRGQRFVDEAQNYNDVGRSLLAFDPVTLGYPRAPSWLVFDAAHRRRYPVGPLLRDDPDPDWLAAGDDWAALASRIGVPPDALADTVARFNAGAAQGADPDFARGTFAYDRFLGDATAAHPTLRPLDRPPFYAVRVDLGCLGTKGGPRTDADGRVRRWDGTPVPGLFAAGNAAASPLGLAYPGAGGTIGPALVFGTRAGETAAAT
jgi:hypothetical protein